MLSPCVSCVAWCAAAAACLHLLPSAAVPSAVGGGWAQACTVVSSHAVSAAAPVTLRPPLCTPFVCRWAWTRACTLASSCGTPRQPPAAASQVRRGMAQRQLGASRHAAAFSECHAAAGDTVLLLVHAPRCPHAVHCVVLIALPPLLLWLRRPPVPAAPDGSGLPVHHRPRLLHRLHPVPGERAAARQQPGRQRCVRRRAGRDGCGWGAAALRPWWAACDQLCPCWCNGKARRRVTSCTGVDGM